MENPFLLCWKKWKKSLAQERKMIEYRLLYKFLFGERLHMNAILNLICNLIDIFARFLSRRRSSSCWNLSKNVVFWPPSSKKTSLRRWRLSIFYGFCHLPSLQNLLEQRTGWKCSATCQVGVEHVNFWGEVVEVAAGISQIPLNAVVGGLGSSNKWLAWDGCPRVASDAWNLQCLQGISLLGIWRRFKDAAILKRVFCMSL